MLFPEERFVKVTEEREMSSGKTCKLCICIQKDTKTGSMFLSLKKKKGSINQDKIDYKYISGINVPLNEILKFKSMFDLVVFDLKMELKKDEKKQDSQ